MQLVLTLCAEHSFYKKYANINVNSSSALSIEGDLDHLTNLTQTTIIARYRLLGSGIQSILGVSDSRVQNNYMSMWVDGGSFGLELRKQDADGQTDLKKISASNKMNIGVNTVAFKITANDSYKLFANGKLISNSADPTAQFIKSLPNINSAFIGKTQRTGNQYQMTGNIEFLDIYQFALSDEKILEITGQTLDDLPEPMCPTCVRKETEQLFYNGYMDSQAFRIPSLLTTDEGTLIAGIDVRRGGGHDSPNNIDTGIRRRAKSSTIWEEGKVLIDFPGSASVIDTSLLYDKVNKRTWILVTHFAEGYGFGSAKQGSGYTVVDGKKYRSLYNAENEVHTIRDGVVFDNKSQTTKYSVDNNYWLFEDGKNISNVLLGKSPLKVFGTSYLLTIYSDDDGVSWSQPREMNIEIKQEWMKFLGTGPGRGLFIQNGTYKNRLVFPVYYTNVHGFQSAAVMYSDDFGKTWLLGKSPNDAIDNSETMSNGIQLTEAVAVELPEEGHIRLFMRNTGGNLRYATSFDGGASWDAEIINDFNIREPYCQMSAIRYSQRIDDKEAIILVNPNAGSRQNGTISIGLLIENGTYKSGQKRWSIEWKYRKSIFQGSFSYSCITELLNGYIGVHSESIELSYDEMNLDYIMYQPQYQAANITKIFVQNSNASATERFKIFVNFSDPVTLVGNNKLKVLLDNVEVDAEFVAPLGAYQVIEFEVPILFNKKISNVQLKASTPLTFINIYNKTTTIENTLDTDVQLSINDAFWFNKTEFYYNDKPIWITSGEMHPSRIPQQYWRHRIQMAKAMGMNTVATYFFWNAHEQQDGSFDFSSQQNNISIFMQIAQEEGMFVLARPGPYVCGEWDFGGLPAYLLNNLSAKIRTYDDQNFIIQSERYMKAIAPIIEANLLKNGGSVIMVQIENEYGWWPVNRQDKHYTSWIVGMWRQHNINCPFYTADNNMQITDATHPEGASLGLDGPSLDPEFDRAHEFDPTVPVFSSEFYPGWMRHWGETDWEVRDVSGQVQNYIDNKRGFNFYMIHGGTNFGQTAGLNFGNKGQVLADLTSYDYGAPISESGLPVNNFNKYREMIFAAKGEILPDIPAPIPSMKVDAFNVTFFGSLLAQQKILEKSSLSVQHFEAFNQNQGFINYVANLTVGQGGVLKLEQVHDYAWIYLNDKLIKTIDGTKVATSNQEIAIDEVVAPGKLEIFVHAFGHGNYAIQMETDRKGLYGEVTFDGKPIQNWEHQRIPIAANFTSTLKQGQAAGKKGDVYSANVTLNSTDDTFLDMSQFDFGFLFVNGFNLGRYWKVGPTQRLYCPGVFLKKGVNEFVVLELEAEQGKVGSIQGFQAPVGGPNDERF